VDVLRNFLPWEVFQLNPKTATSEDVKSAFNQLAKEHHPDHGGNPDVFEKLKSMRDSLLAAY
jgi:DnaJ-class molecular chaperone